MKGNIKHQIEYAINVNQKNAESLRTLLNISETLEPEGWSPDLYAECINELRRVQMCVVHRSLVFDLLQLCELININDLAEYRSDDDGYGCDREITRSDYKRIIDRLEQALEGLPPE